jgi:translation initiation factor IF-2
VGKAAWPVPRQSLERAPGPEPGRPAGGAPRGALWGPGPPRAEGRALRLGGEGAGPRGEDRPQAALPPAGVGGQRQGLSGSRSGVHKQGGQAAVGGARPRAACLGERHGAQPGRDRPGEPRRLGQPRGGGVRRPRGSRPVRAGMRAVREGPARWARLARPPKSRRTAPGEGRPGGPGAWGPTGGACGARGGAIAAAARRQCQPGRPPVDWRGRPGGAAAPRGPGRQRGRSEGERGRVAARGGPQTAGGGAGAHPPRAEAWPTQGGTWAPTPAGGGRGPAGLAWTQGGEDTARCASFNKALQPTASS